ncbi:hypothetical protein HanRHA438_Chr03g0144441 [Helianthus annuus]|nr:hypothetical protein HanRHA438_Chr03g0144441 [Helianthus annuus]
MHKAHTYPQSTLLKCLPTISNGILDHTHTVTLFTKGLVVTKRVMNNHIPLIYTETNNQFSIIVLIYDTVGVCVCPHQIMFQYGPICMCNLESKEGRGTHFTYQTNFY